MSSDNVSKNKRKFSPVFEMTVIRIRITSNLFSLRLKMLSQIKHEKFQINFRIVVEKFISRSMSINPTSDLCTNTNNRVNPSYADIVKGGGKELRSF